MKPSHDCCHHHGDHHTDPGPTRARPGQWTCPMDPEVVSDHPGDCPKCGMAVLAPHPRLKQRFD